MRGIKESNEWQVYGIPGAGKTTYLTKAINNAAHKAGGHNLIVSSFTKAAAEELTGRDLPIPQQNIGTLHSLCYRGIGSPELAEKHISEFNERFPRLAMSKGKSVDMDEGEADQQFETEVDKLFADYQVLRARLTPRNKWGNRVQDLASCWETWKQENCYIDFTDMIELALHDMPYPPNNATIGVFDEAQDFTPLQLQLVRKWAKQLDYIMIAGDDDQAIFGFTGADPHVLINADVPPERKVILDRSYRVPRVVQEHAQAWIERIKVREPKDQKPKLGPNGEVVEGKLSRMDCSYRQAEAVVDRIERELSDMESDQDIMVLASCSYMLLPIIYEMRGRGIPFANKYKRKNGSWNPLSPGKGVSTASRIVAYMEPEGPKFAKRRLWTQQQLASWLELCQAKKLLKHGAKKRINEAVGTELSAKGLFDLIGESFLPEALNEAVKLDLEWFKKQVTSKKANSVEFPMAVLKRYGREALDATPRVIPGTVHSVKGGQADKVLLFPDISMQAAQYAETIAGKESIIRQFYVGMTRAKEELIIASPASSLHIPI